MHALARPLAAALLGLGAALLVSCGGSGTGLIPETNAGPLRGDFEAVAQAAQSGNGSCAGTEAALAKTERDLQGLPASVDAGLRDRLKQGVANLRRRALAICAQPVPGATTATTAPPPTETTPPPSTSTPTSTATTPATPPSNQGGGTEAPGGEEAEGAAHGVGKGKGKDGGESAGEADGGAGSGGTSAGGGK